MTVDSAQKDTLERQLYLLKRCKEKAKSWTNLARFTGLSRNRINLLKDDLSPIKLFEYNVLLEYCIEHTVNISQIELFYLFNIYTKQALEGRR